jgi:hypothetical protein
VSLREGHYTEILNQYGREGWELVSVTPDVVEARAPDKAGSGIPVPRALGKLEDAAAKLNKLGADDSSESAPATTPLLWVLRRPLDDDD